MSGGVREGGYMNEAVDVGLQNVSCMKRSEQEESAYVSKCVSVTVED
jgi:hypothetical protein